MAEPQELLKRTIEKIGKKKLSSDLSNYIFGKVPPQARDLEQAVLGALMLEKDALNTVIDIIKPESFYVEANQKIFRCIQRLFSKTEPVDILTVTEELRKSGELEDVGGPYYIMEMTNRVASAANVEYHARIIAQKYIQRELIRISTEIINQAYEDTTDVFDLLDKAEKDIFSITDENLRRNFSSLSHLLLKSMDEIEKAKDHDDALTGVPTGFPALDRITSGWQKSDLIIIAARPGMGKTSFVLSMARNAAVDFKKPIAFFSLEMGAEQLTKRLISAETELSMDKIIRGNLAPFEWQQLLSKVGSLQEAPIFIDDTPAINIFELRAKCRRLKTQYNVQLFIIDYLQLMSGTSENRGMNREQEISNISRSLKNIAKELKTPVIALSQLNRSVETRGGNKKPQLSDLRESGAIEQDADLVLFIYRPETYGLTENENGASTIGMAEIIIAKHRNGPLATVQTKFIDRFTKFAPAEIEFQQTAHISEPSNEAGFISRSSRLNEMHEEEEGSEPPF